MVEQKDIPYTKEEVQAMVNTIDALRKEKEEMLDRISMWLMYYASGYFYEDCYVDATELVKDLIEEVTGKKEEFIIAHEEVFDNSFAQQVGELPVIEYAVSPEDDLKIGDKVKLIIVKENCIKENKT